MTPQQLKQKFNYTSIGPFHEGLAWAVQDGKYFHIRPNGNPAYTARYDAVGHFHEGLARARQDGKYFHIRLDGNPAYTAR
ncbi:MAG: WG repeat-containing protein, partial [Proteobacteria bacterium]|nr:WG repeat-containing protein [Pseudomonadota bacterium]